MKLWGKKTHHQSLKIPTFIYDFYEILQLTLTMKNILFKILLWFLKWCENGTSEGFVILPMSKIVSVC